jgi:CRP-like cAMP-binding protein
MPLMNTPVTTATAHSAFQARPISAIPELAAKATEFLKVCSPQFKLTANEAACIVALMRIVTYPPGAAVFRAGEAAHTGYMLLVLEGDISVDTGTVGGGAKVDISILGPGALIGELSLIDGGPRSANCTAVTAVTAAGFAVGALQHLAEQTPQVATKLALFIAKNAADRLRALSEQLQMFDQLNASLHQEIARLKSAAS